MVLSSSPNKILPEERIRLAWIQKMVRDLGYPRHMVAVEKELSQLPHLLGQKLPKRRADIIIFASNIHPDHALYPLLMIECKATKLLPHVASQVIGYNEFVKAPYIAIANDEDLMLGSFDESAGMICFSRGLKSYEQLVAESLLKKTTL